MPILPPPSRITLFEALSDLIKPEFHHEAKEALMRLASAGDIEVRGCFVELSHPHHQLDEEIRPIKHHEDVIHPGELAVADWDWDQSRLSFETVSRDLPEPRNQWYEDVSFTREKLEELLGAAYREPRKSEPKKPGPKENSKWIELLEIAKDLSRNHEFESAENFYDVVRDRAEEMRHWAPKSNTSFKNRLNFVALARQSLRSSD